MSNAAIGYLRVSTDDQATSGLGLEAQRAAIQAAAQRLGLKVTAWHEDAGVSGAASLERRPGLLAALAEVERGAVLVVAKRCRLSRDPVVTAMVERLTDRKGVRIISAAGEGTDGDDPSSILMRRIVDAFSEYERLVIKARTKAALGAKRRRGESCGGNVPYGWRQVGDQWVEDDAEQRVMADIVAARAKGMSLRAIAAALTAKGLMTKQGGAWGASQVSRVLRYAAEAQQRRAS